MKYIALLSGGKDSCFNLLHCHKNGHELVAAASLGPGPGKDELDSFMYQTVGQDAIEYVARALDVPLYRKVISGSAVEQGLEYGARKTRALNAINGDETEDLYDLLSTVKAAHPDAQGVSVGAILSNYQRVRVEHVCRRLGLTPLCYLWQRDQSELLSEMVESGMEAILIKVAGIGLKPDHLGKTLAQMQPTLLRLNDLYGSHVCGEGGEYETLTLDCPLFKQRIVPTETETVIHSDNDFATVAYLRIKAASLRDKAVHTDFNLEIPPLLQYKLAAIKEDLERQVLGSLTPSNTVPITAGAAASNEPHQGGVTTNIKNSWISVSNIQVPSPGPEISIEDEVRQCFELLQEKLSEYSLDLSHCSNVNIFLSSMDLFTRVNAIYGSYFGISPPTRACVAVDLPSPARVRLECTAFKETTAADRTALHVQGLSYWAPANIGPYSQAIVADQHIFVSGQIGLIPASLTLPTPPLLAMEFALSCQHVKRVINALRDNSSWEGHPQSIIYWLVEADHLPLVKSGHDLLHKTVPTLFVVVKALPKGALVEKQVLYHTGRFTTMDEDGEISTELEEPEYEEGNLGEESSSWHWEVSYFRNESVSASFLLICARGQTQLSSPDTVQVKNVLGSLWIQALSARIFYIPHRPTNAFKILQSAGLKCSDTYIPCSSISTSKDDNWDIAICIMGV